MPEDQLKVLTLSPLTPPEFLQALDGTQVRRGGGATARYSSLLAVAQASGSRRCGKRPKVCVVCSPAEPAPGPLKRALTSRFSTAALINCFF